MDNIAVGAVGALMMILNTLSLKLMVNCLYYLIGMEKNIADVGKFQIYLIVVDIQLNLMKMTKHTIVCDLYMYQLIMVILKLLDMM